MLGRTYRGLTEGALMQLRRLQKLLHWLLQGSLPSAQRPAQRHQL